MSARKTSLSVSPHSIEMADSDIHNLLFEAGEAITGATAEMLNQETLAVVAGVIGTVVVGTDDATVPVSGLTRGTSYELSVVFTRANGTKWTRTLAIDCVA